MEMNIHDDTQIVEIWLTNAEKTDPVLQNELKGIYAEYKAKKYMVAVFQSGQGDLYENVQPPSRCRAGSAGTQGGRGSERGQADASFWPLAMSNGLIYNQPVEAVRPNAVCISEFDRQNRAIPQEKAP